jgi:hypothetical protein
VEEPLVANSFTGPEVRVWNPESTPAPVRVKRYGSRIGAAGRFNHIESELDYRPLLLWPHSTERQS